MMLKILDDMQMRGNVMVVEDGSFDVSNPHEA